MLTHLPMAHVPSQGGWRGEASGAAQHTPIHAKLAADAARPQAQAASQALQQARTAEEAAAEEVERLEARAAAAEDAATDAAAGEQQLRGAQLQASGNPCLKEESVSARPRAMPYYAKYALALRQLLQKVQRLLRDW